MFQEPRVIGESEEKEEKKEIEKKKISPVWLKIMISNGVKTCFPQWVTWVTCPC